MRPARLFLLPLLLVACGGSSAFDAADLLHRLRKGRGALPQGQWLAVDEDGTVWSASGKLWWPGAGSEGRVHPYVASEPDVWWRLHDWLRDAATVMPVEEREFPPLNWPVRGGTLRLWIHPDAAPAVLGDVLKCCQRPGVGIYRIELALGPGEEPVGLRLVLEGCRWDPPQLADVRLRLHAKGSPWLEAERDFAQGRWCLLRYRDERAAEHPQPYQMAPFREWLAGLEEGAEIRVECEPRIRFHQLVPVLEIIRDRPSVQLTVVTSLRELGAPILLRGR